MTHDQVWKQTRLVVGMTLDTALHVGYTAVSTIVQRMQDGMISQMRACLCNRALPKFYKFYTDSSKDAASVRVLGTVELCVILSGLTSR